MSQFLENVYHKLVNGLTEHVPRQNIFRYVVPAGFHERTEDPIIKINALPQYPGRYADDRQLSEESNIQIDIYQAYEEPFFIGEIIKALMRIEGYQQLYQESLYEDEDEVNMFREIRRYQGFFINEEEN